VQKSDYKFILSLDDVLASRGGIPLIEDGKIIGAIGYPGGTGSQDEAVCTAAAATINSSPGRRRTSIIISSQRNDAPVTIGS